MSRSSRLHGPGGKGMDIVDGRRLAEALCPPSTNATDRQRPAVVVLASCDSGARQDVWYTGASMAQVLHGAGIPLVVASQFPLSKVGSVILAEELYKRLFWGEDPRRALYFARRELKSRVPQAHDYVSMVAYAALPDDLERQLLRLRLGRLVELLKVSKKWEEAPVNKTRLTPPQLAAGAKARLEHATDRLKAELAITSDPSKADRGGFSEACGLLGSAFKRRAEQEYNERPADRNRWRQSLTTARDWYKDGSKEPIYAGSGMISHWNAVQYLALSAVLDGALLGLDKIWRRARACAEADAHDPTRPNDQIWAQGSLAELWMLRPLTAPTVESHWATAEKRATEHVRELQQRAPVESYFIESTRAQLRRYVEWWGLERWKDLKHVVAIARKLLELLPSNKGAARSQAERARRTRKPTRSARASRPT